MVLSIIWRDFVEIYVFAIERLYMSKFKELLQDILNQAYPDLGQKYELEFKNSFGAVAGYADGNIFCSYGKFGFALKLLDEDVEQLLQKGVKPLQYFPNGHVKKNYAVLPDAIMQDNNQLTGLIKKSMEFVTN